MFMGIMLEVYLIPDMPHLSCCLYYVDISHICIYYVDISHICIKYVIYVDISQISSTKCWQIDFMWKDSLCGNKKQPTYIFMAESINDLTTLKNTQVGFILHFFTCFAWFTNSEKHPGWFYPTLFHLVFMGYQHWKTPRSVLSYTFLPGLYVWVNFQSAMYNVFEKYSSNLKMFTMHLWHFQAEKGDLCETCSAKKLFTKTVKYGTSTNSWKWQDISKMMASVF